MDLILILVMLLLPIIAQINVTTTFNRYAKKMSRRGLTADQVARMILDENGLTSVRIERIGGKLTDHYDPVSNVVRLSDSVYGNSSIASIGVAAHECGHACQHAESYAPIVLRSKIVPVVNICSRFWYFVFIAGILFSNVRSTSPLLYVGIAMFAAVVFFQIVTLPTEFDASRRAMKTIEGYSVLESDELSGTRKVLTAAAMTYVAGLVASILQLMRLLLNARRR